MEEEFYLPNGMAFVLESNVCEALNYIPFKEDERKQILDKMSAKSLLGIKVDYYTFFSRVLDIFKELQHHEFLAVTFLRHLDLGHGSFEQDQDKYATFQMVDCGKYFEDYKVPTTGEIVELMDFLLKPKDLGRKPLPSLFRLFLWNTMELDEVFDE